MIAAILRASSRRKSLSFSASSSGGAGYCFSSVLSSRKVRVSAASARDACSISRGWTGPAPSRATIASMAGRTRGDTSGLRPDWISKLGRLMDALDLARKPQELAMTGAGFHALRGDLKGHYAMTVSRNWRLTFSWDGEDAVDVDLEDYHG